MRRTTAYTLVSILAVGLLWMGSSAPVAALENAWGYNYDANQASYAAIETANPAIRDGGFSYMRTGVQRIINGNVYYVEIGWYVSASNPNPRYHWTYRATNGVVDSGEGGAPGCCNGYNYQVLDVGAGDWQIFYNDLSTPVVTVGTGFDTADDYFSGGETSSANNAMGISGDWNVSYRRNGTWYCACDWQPWITNSVYYVARLNNTSWQVGGNN